jgi:TolA-binding protein
MKRQDGVDALARFVRGLEDAALEHDVSDETTRHRIAEHAAARTPRSWRRAWMASSCAAAALAAAFAIVRFVEPRWSRQLTFTVGEPPAQGKLGELLAASGEAAFPIRFSEGTTVFLRPGARGRVTAVRAKGAEVIVESGRARIEVTPRPHADWHVRTGPVDIAVKGTRFETAYDPQTDDFSIELEDGEVIVTGCGLDGRHLATGQHLTASCSPREVRPARPLADEAPPQIVAAAPADEPKVARKSAPTGERAAGSRSWIDLARDGRFEDAYELVRDAFDTECARRPAAELWLLGDVARLSGHPGKARRAYMALRDRFPGSPESADAAFALGRLALQANDDRPAGQRWFEAHLRERPNGPLAPAALGRLMELRLELDDRPGATVIAREYLRRYPSGPHAAEAQKLLALPGAERP